MFRFLEIGAHAALGDFAFEEFAEPFALLFLGVDVGISRIT